MSKEWRASARFQRWKYRMFLEVHIDNRSKTIIVYLDLQTEIWLINFGSLGLATVMSTSPPNWTFISQTSSHTAPGTFLNISLQKLLKY